MIFRLRVWNIRRKARILSKYTKVSVNATMGNIRVGTFRNGREVRR